MLTIYEEINLPNRRNQVWCPVGWDFSQLVWKMLMGGWPFRPGGRENHTIVLSKWPSALPIDLFPTSPVALAMGKQEVGRDERGTGASVQGCTC